MDSHRSCNTQDHDAVGRRLLESIWLPRYHFSYPWRTYVIGDEELCL